MIDSILDSIPIPEFSLEIRNESLPNQSSTSTNELPNIFNRLSYNYPLQSSNFRQRYNSIESINNNSYLITINEENKQNYIEEECSICNINYSLNDIIRKFDKCPHYFHYKCIDTWLNTNKKCPVCTIDIV